MRHERRTGGVFFRAVTAVVLATVAVVGLTAGVAGAHRIDESYIYLDVYEDTVEGRLELNVRELNAVLGLGIDEDDKDVAGPVVLAARDAIEAYVAPRFGLGADGESWEIDFTDVELINTENGVFTILHFEVPRTFATTPDVVDVRYEAFFDEVGGHVGLFHIGNYWEGGVFANEANPVDTLLPFSSSNTSQSFDLEDPDFWQGFRGVIRLGVDHIRIGTDHILFIVALLLPSVLVFRLRDWEPATDFRSSLWRVLKLATMFTLAHSITLSLAGLGVFELPSKPVEIIIAVSIILAALNNLRPVVVNREWVLAFGFGLFHGLGFAGLLSDLGLDRSNKVWSLLAFNLGVEIGQVAIVLLLFPVLFILRRTTLYHIGFRVVSLVVASIAFLWMLERIFETNLRINKLIDPLVEVPRAYLGIALLFVAAAGWAKLEQGRGRLRGPALQPGRVDPPPREPVSTRHGDDADARTEDSVR